MSARSNSGFFQRLFRQKTTTTEQFDACLMTDDDVALRDKLKATQEKSRQLTLRLSMQTSVAAKAIQLQDAVEKLAAAQGFKSVAVVFRDASMGLALSETALPTPTVSIEYISGETAAHAQLSIATFDAIFYVADFPTQDQNVCLASQDNEAAVKAAASVNLGIESLKGLSRGAPVIFLCQRELLRCSFENNAMCAHKLKV